MTKDKEVRHIVYPLNGKGMQKYCRTEIEAKETVFRWNQPKPAYSSQENTLQYTYKTVHI